MWNGRCNHTWIRRPNVESCPASGNPSQRRRGGNETWWRENILEWNSIFFSLSFSWNQSCRSSRHPAALLLTSSKDYSCGIFLFPRASPGRLARCCGSLACFSQLLAPRGSVSHSFFFFFAFRRKKRDSSRKTRQSDTLSSATSTPAVLVLVGWASIFCLSSEGGSIFLKWLLFFSLPPSKLKREQRRKDLENRKKNVGVNVTLTAASFHSQNWWINIDNVVNNDDNNLFFYTLSAESPLPFSSPNSSATFTFLCHPKVPSINLSLHRCLLEHGGREKNGQTPQTTCWLTDAHWYKQPCSCWHKNRWNQINSSPLEYHRGVLFFHYF